MKTKIIFGLVLFATLSGCYAPPKNPANSDFPSVRVQNQAIQKHLKNVYYVEVKQITTNGPKLIADFADKETINVFKKTMRVTQPAAQCFCRGDIFFTCYKSDGTMIELWYEPGKLSGANGSNIYGVPTQQFNSTLKKICEKGVMKKYGDTILIR